MRSQLCTEKGESPGGENGQERMVKLESVASDRNWRNSRKGTQRETREENASRGRRKKQCLRAVLSRAASENFPRARERGKSSILREEGAKQDDSKKVGESRRIAGGKETFSWCAQGAQKRLIDGEIRKIWKNREDAETA